MAIKAEVMLMDLINVALRLIFIILSIASIGSLSAPLLHRLSQHGKLKHNKEKNAQQVSKRYFSWFYVYGWNWNGIFLYICVTLSPNVTTIALLSMLQLHLSRRAFESMRITAFGNSSMHTLALVLGFGHYFLVSLAIALDPSTRDAQSLSFASYVGIVLFFVASYHQFRCNIILSRAKAAAKGYVIPRGDWFEYFTCPLYTTEVLIYIALWAISAFQNTNVGFIVVWVVSNQAVSAYVTRRWYLGKFPDFPRERWVLLPFL